jgi:hypothetical protein
MQIGEIYVWETDKASGHWLRKKWQVFICAGNWQDDNTFLFVNSGTYGGDFAISNTDYPFFPLATCYIGCNGTVSYTDAELAAAQPRFEGRLKPEHFAPLHDAIWASDTLEQWKILRV